MIGLVATAGASSRAGETEAAALPPQNNKQEKQSGQTKKKGGCTVVRNSEKTKGRKERAGN